MLPHGDFVTHFNKELQLFREHRFRSHFLAMQRDRIWNHCPNDWLVLSVDWSSNYERKGPVVLTCQQTRKAVVCPIVLQRVLQSVNPLSDPLVTGVPALPELLRKKSGRRVSPSR